MRSVPKSLTTRPTVEITLPLSCRRKRRTIKPLCSDGGYARMSAKPTSSVRSVRPSARQSAAILASGLPPIPWSITVNASWPAF